ncbi:MAG: amino acid transporter, partial [Gemmataceae bacterium]|nr:amino acid transporter [Gemmataceae bacterium]
LFDASVDAQGGAYATGVLVLMTSAAVAVTLSCRRRKAWWSAIGFGAVTLVFGYTLVTNVIERPDGLKIASFFIGGIVLVSLVSRVWRTLELRVERVELDDAARRFIDELGDRPIHLIAHRPGHRRRGAGDEYAFDEKDQRGDFHIPADEPVLFLEVHVRDASDFTGVLRVRGEEIGGHRVLRVEATAVPNGIAAFLLHLRDATGKRPHAYFDWGEGNPFLHLIQYVLSGQGDVAAVTREVVRQAEPDPAKRPAIYAGG